MDTEETSLPPKPPSKGGVGPVLGIIIIIILLALGGLYYFTTGINELKDTNPNAAMTPEEEAAAIATQGTSSSLTDISTDVEATDLSGLDNSAASVDSNLQTQ